VNIDYFEVGNYLKNTKYFQINMGFYTNRSNAYLHVNQNINNSQVNIMHWNTVILIYFMSL